MPRSRCRRASIGSRTSSATHQDEASGRPWRGPRRTRRSPGSARPAGPAACEFVRTLRTASPESRFATAGPAVRPAARRRWTRAARSRRRPPAGWRPAGARLPSRTSGRPGCRRSYPCRIPAWLARGLGRQEHVPARDAGACRPAPSGPGTARCRSGSRTAGAARRARPPGRSPRPDGCSRGRSRSRVVRAPAPTCRYQGVRPVEVEHRPEDQVRRPARYSERTEGRADTTRPRTRAAAARRARSSGR